MMLREYMELIPRGRRGKVRLALAELHGCSVELVRKWENFPPPPDWPEEKIKAMSRPHPAVIESIKITEAFTNNRVTGFDLRPDIFARKAQKEGKQ